MNAENNKLMRIDISLLYKQFPGLSQLMEIYAHYDHDIRLVGGCVRNAVLAKEIHDIDLATPCPPEESEKLLKKEGVKVVPTGVSHGTITAVLQGQAFEITTLRRDMETTGRYARVCFTDSWEIDAGRRDFTFNALYVDATGQVYDYFNGLSDLEVGIVRFIGDPHARIREDYLRILRLFRFHAYYAQQPIQPKALEACQKHAEYLKTLSRERVTQEMEKIIMAEGALEALTAMESCDVLKKIFHSYSLERFKGVVMQEPPLPPWLPRRLAALTSHLDSLRLRRRTIQDCHKIWKVAENPSEAWYFLYTFGHDITLSGLMLADALTLELRTEMMKQMDFPPFPLNGRDLLARGIPSQEIGGLLMHVQKWWARERYRPSREACLKACQDSFNKNEI